MEFMFDGIQEYWDMEFMLTVCKSIKTWSLCWRYARVLRHGVYVWRYARVLRHGVYVDGMQEY